MSNPANSFEQKVNSNQSLQNEIKVLDSKLEKYFSSVLKTNPDLDRSIVSFQSSKKTPLHRWYKYKEAFSAELVEYFIRRYKPAGRVLDPFAGIGTTLFSSAECSYDSEGIELLPIGQFLISARKTIQNKLKSNDLILIKNWSEKKPWRNSASTHNLNELRITKDAYPLETKIALEKYISFLDTQPNDLKEMGLFAVLCILESISYTRKDGQYLRWDHRSGRRPGENNFNKGVILSFDEAITQKLKEIFVDLTGTSEQLDLFDSKNKQKDKKGKILLHKGSCLSILPKLDPDTYSFSITSPPYCNRYDYTRTYALELALLGFNETQVINLRQEMLSCTVENREKDLSTFSPSWAFPVSLCEKNELLESIISYLNDQKRLGELNNTGIPRMVKGYFIEMSCVIYEMHRILKPGARFIMVNDNVRYAGIPISVDLILSKIAEKCGFCVEEIMVLPTGKGNSSQQMGAHGRSPLRKCIYVWRKL